MNKKGFTLIELLAIIVILAIIAVITVPIILNIIDESKQGATTDSAYGYKDGILNYSAYLQAVNPNSAGIKGSYTVTELKTTGLKVTGKEPSEGIVLVDNEGVSGCLQFDEYASYLYNSKVINTVKSKCPTVKLATTGDGLYKSETEPGRLIYRGENPNNRIFLSEDGTNNTLYRIVSYEIDGTIKVIRDEKLSTNMAWDKRTNTSSGPRKNSNNTFCNYSGTYCGCNVWGNGSNTFYSGSPIRDNFHYFYYEGPISTTLSNGDSGTVTSDSTLNTYLNSKILNSGNSWQAAIVLDNYIDNHQWNVGGIYRTDEDKGIVKEKEEEKQLQWIGKIGLLNITEFAEASINPNCTSVRSNFGAAGYPCKDGNWLMYNKSYQQWSLSPETTDHYRVYAVFSSGDFSSLSSFSTSISVRPAFYLKSGLSLSGTGASGSEYTIE